MSLSVDGIWKAGVWDTGVWADGVWFEGTAINIAATLETKTITTYPATVVQAIAISTTSVSKTITTYPASVLAGVAPIEINASIVKKFIKTYPALISAPVKITYLDSDIVETIPEALEDSEEQQRILIENTILIKNLLNSSQAQVSVLEAEIDRLNNKIDITELQQVERNSGSIADQFFGTCSVSSDGSVAVFSAPSFDGLVDYGPGYVEVREWNSSTNQYDFIKQLIPSIGVANSDHHAVQILVSPDGSTIFICSSEYDSEKGIIIVWQKVGGVWTEVQLLQPTLVAAGDKFGFRFSCGASGQRLVATSPFKDSNRGEGYIFEATLSNWSTYTETVLQPSTRIVNDFFGYDCCMSGNGQRVFISAATSTLIGNVYYFNRSGTWPSTETGTITNPYPVAVNKFGVGSWDYDITNPTFLHYTTNCISCTTTGDIVIIGSNGWKNLLGENIGAAFFFSYNGSGFDYKQLIEPKVTIGTYYYYAASLKITPSGKYLFIGSQSESIIASKIYTGFGYLYRFEDSLFQLKRRFSFTDYQAEEYAFYMVDIIADGTRILANGVDWSDSEGYIYANNNVGRTKVFSVDWRD